MYILISLHSLQMKDDYILSISYIVLLGIITISAILLYIFRD